MSNKRIINPNKVDFSSFRQMYDSLDAEARNNTAVRFLHTQAKINQIVNQFDVNEYPKYKGCIILERAMCKDAINFEKTGIPEIDDLNLLNFLHSRYYTL